MLMRERMAEDLTDLVALARTVHHIDGYPPYLPNDDFVGFFQSGHPIAAWVAVDGTEIVGHVSLHGSSSPGVLELAADVLGVHPQDCGVIARLMVGTGARRSGVGRRLLDHAVATCRQRQLTPILDVVDRFAAAISLYERAGWTRIGTVDVGLPDDTRLREHVYTFETSIDE